MRHLTVHICSYILMLHGLSCIVLRNLALHKQAYQTSTGWDGVASRAVDGNTNGHYASNSCTHTEFDHSGEYWEVDLGKIFLIDHVTIYDRTDGPVGVTLLRNLEVYLGWDQSSYTLAGTYNDLVVVSVVINMTPKIYARWVRVTRHPTVELHLALCEVTVFGRDAKVKFRRFENSSGIGQVVAEYSAYSSLQCSVMCTDSDTCAGFNVQDRNCSLLSTSVYEHAPNSNTTFYLPMM